MTEDEVSPYVGAPVRVALADGVVLAGTLKLHGAEHGHAHYLVVSDPIVEGGAAIQALIPGAFNITEIVDAADDPAAVE